MSYHRFLRSSSPPPGLPSSPPPLSGSACSPLSSAVLIRVTSEADFIKRRSHLPSTSVILELQNHVTLKRGLLFGPKYACTILRSGGKAKGRGYRLYVHLVDEPILRIWNTSNVIVYRVQMSQPFRAYSRACPREIPEVGTDIICPLIHVYRSYGVQIVKGYTFGRVDMIRSMHSRIDSMKMTAVSDFKRGNGVIRVMLSGYGPLLVRCYIYVTNNEIYGAYLPVLFQFGVVGAVFKNNHVHDYVWAAITCGNMVHLQVRGVAKKAWGRQLHAPHHLRSENLVVAAGSNLNVSHSIPPSPILSPPSQGNCMLHKKTRATTGTACEPNTTAVLRFSRYGPG
ncbi:unnamed protein product [Closterium sp. Naga37s-1]|nr:unnamed protein product [Closterium sp. Naga37s-1]